MLEQSGQVMESEAQAGAQARPRQECRRGGGGAQTAVETVRIERSVGGEDDDIASSTSLEDRRFRGGGKMGEMFAEDAELGPENVVVAGVGHIGDIE